MADLELLALMMSYCDFVTFPCGNLGEVWYLIVLIPDLCCLSYFSMNTAVGNVTKDEMYTYHMCNRNNHISNFSS